MTELKSGDRFGRLVVIERAPDYVTASGKKYPRYLCKCDCGNTKMIDKRNLIKGFTNSCGCLHKERTSIATTTHHDTDSRLYNVWSAIKRRCYNKTVPEYRRYGARGITMCDEWREDYGSFMKWALDHGYDPNAKRGECTIDRIDNDKGYFPDNCRWAPISIQANNHSANHRVNYEGKTYTISELARKFNVEYSKLYQRVIRYGWDIDRAIQTA